VYYPTVYRQPVYTTSASDRWVSFAAGALVGGLLTAAIMWDDDDDDWYDGWGYRHHIWHHGPGYWDRRWGGPRYGSREWKSWRGDVHIHGDVCIGRCINIDRKEWKRQARTFEHRPEHRGGVRYRDLSNVAARHPDVGTTLPARPDKRPGRPGAGAYTRPARPPERPDLARPDRPAIATRPAQRPDRPGAGTRPGRPGASVDADRAGIAMRPAQRPARPDSGDDGRRPGASTRPAERPRPETRPAQRPTKPEARPATKPAPATREVRRAPESSKVTSFQRRDTAAAERKASQRGAWSRGKSSAQTRSFSQPQPSARSVNRSPQASKGGAFQSRGSSSMERRASQRGAYSLGGGSKRGR
jgi:hypothetical protein